MTNVPISIPEDIRRQASHIAKMYHQERLKDDLATTIAKALTAEREQCAAIANAMPAEVEKAPGLMRRLLPSDVYAALMRARS